VSAAAEWTAFHRNALQYIEGDAMEAMRSLTLRTAKRLQKKAQRGSSNFTHTQKRKGKI
jgi:hypothetical protein